LDIIKVEQRAQELFGKGGLFCAESVLTAVSAEAGIASSLIPRIATGFCGGISRSRGICGAVTGGVMALGIVFGRDSAAESHETVYKKVQQFLQAFEEECKSTNCFELTGCDLNTEEGRQTFYHGGVVERCRVFTGKAASLAARLINDGKGAGE
jgi:C_GCAxxG_C_C family probable redox protein